MKIKYNSDKFFIFCIVDHTYYNRLYFIQFLFSCHEFKESHYGTGWIIKHDLLIWMWRTRTTGKWAEDQSMCATSCTTDIR